MDVDVLLSLDHGDQDARARGVGKGEGDGSCPVKVSKPRTSSRHRRVLLIDLSSHIQGVTIHTWATVYLAGYFEEPSVESLVWWFKVEVQVQVDRVPTP